MDSNFNNMPSIKQSALIILMYLLLSIPIVIGIAYILVCLGYSPETLKENLSEITFAVQIVITSALILFLARNYSKYLLSNRWKLNFSFLFYVGLKWSLPLICIHALFWLIPSTRGQLVSNYLSFNYISIKDAKIISLILFTFFVIFGAIFEEFFFRGILIQRLQRHISKNLCVFISALLFCLAHILSFENIPGNLTSTFIVGLIYGYSFLSTGSCISSIVPHLLNNILCVGFVWYIWISKV